MIHRGSNKDEDGHTWNDRKGKMPGLKGKGRTEIELN